MIEKKIRYVFICKKKMEKIFFFFKKISLIIYAIMNQVKQTQTQSCLIFFFISNLHVLKKIRSVSKKDTNQFLIEKNSNLHLMKMQIHFYFEKKLDLHLVKMQICFCIEKKLDLHLIKRQICFYFEKSQIYIL